MKEKFKLIRSGMHVGRMRILALPFLLLLTIGSAGQPSYKDSYLPVGSTTKDCRQDTLGDLRTFLQVCNIYKELPLQLDLILNNFSNRIDAPEDTMAYHALFYLQKEGAYIRFGEVEQLINDSLVLLVNKAIKRMILYANHQSVAERIRAYAGFQSKDSSLLHMAGQYTAAQLPPSGDTSMIEMKTRALLPGTSLPKETVLVAYDPATHRPYSVRQTRLSLMPVSKDVYLSKADLPEWKGKCGMLPDSSFFIIKMRMSDFLYKGLSHLPGSTLPVKVSDCIITDTRGKYRPAAGYSDFVLTQNF